jgi:hypothetical protein
VIYGCDIAGLEAALPQLDVEYPAVLLQQLGKPHVNQLISPIVSNNVLYYDY